LKDGIPVSIVGAPNVGKSTLLNSILNEDKAITSPIAGTTRDIIEDTFNLNGKLFRFIDTAGIRKTDDEIEKIGIARTLESIDKSEIVLYLIDSTSSDKDIGIEIDQLNKLKDKYQGKSIILIFTKTDLVKKQIKMSELNPLLINTKEKKDVDYLKNKIIENLNQNFSNKLIITNSRHYSALSLAKKEINNVKEGLKNNIPSDLLTVDLKQVLYHLGEVTGEVTNDEVLSIIFSRFCIGK
jgi:tRNA modification GTPase